MLISYLAIISSYQEHCTNVPVNYNTVVHDSNSLHCSKDYISKQLAEEKRLREEMDIEMELKNEELDHLRDVEKRLKDAEAEVRPDSDILHFTMRIVGQ